MHMTTTHLSIKFGHIFIQSGYIDIFLSRVSILTRDINIANLSVCLSICPSVRPSVRYVPVLYENGLSYCHSFFSQYGSPIILVLQASNLCHEIPTGSPTAGALSTGGV